MIFSRWRRFVNRGTIVGCVVLLNLLFLGIGYYNFHKSSSESISEHIPQYDSKVGPLPRSMAATITPNWRLLVVVAISSSNPDPVLRYLDVAYRRHKAAGLQVVGINKLHATDLELMKLTFDLTFPLINDSQGEVYKSLQLDDPHSHGAIVMVDSEYRVKFSNFVLPKDDKLRILIEKYLLGTVDYSYHQTNAEAFFQLGETPNSLLLRPLGENDQKTFQAKELAGKNLILFMASCATCQLGHYIKVLASYEKQESVAKKSIAVFASNFPAGDIPTYLRESNISIPVYILGNNTGLQDEYITRYEVERDAPMVVSFDGNGRVKEVRPFLEGLEGEDTQ